MLNEILDTCIGSNRLIQSVFFNNFPEVNAAVSQFCNIRSVNRKNSSSNP